VAEDPVEVLRRWESSGALWRVLSRHDDALEVGLFTCDGGEEMSRLVSDDAALHAYVGDRGSSEDGE
jgi:hypothetical protein